MNRGAVGGLKDELHYFTHLIDWKLYGGWFRVVSQGQLEVLALGMMATVALADRDPETVAREVLEGFVRRRAEPTKRGTPPP